MTVVRITEIKPRGGAFEIFKGVFDTEVEAKEKPSHNKFMRSLGYTELSKSLDSALLGLNRVKLWERSGNQPQKKATSRGAQIVLLFI